MAWGSCYTPDFRVANTLGSTLMNTAQANDRRLVEGAAAPASLGFNLSAIDTGRYAVRCDSTTGSVNLHLALIAASSRYSGGLCRFQRVSGTAASQVICTCVASTTTDNVKVRVSSGGVLGYSFNNGSTYVDTALNVNTGVHALEVFVDWDTGTTHTLKIRVDGIEVVSATGGASVVTAATVNAPIQFGGTATTNSVIDFADLVTYNDVAQYGTMNDWRVYGLEPTSDGAHSMTANDFQDDASANLSNSTTTSWSKVDDAPSAAPGVTDFVKQVVLRTTSYMEWVLRTDGIGALALAPVLVCLVAAMHPVASATNVNQAAFRLNSGGNLSTEAVVDTSLTADTLEYRKHHYLTEPGSGAAWTLNMAKALRARFGYSGDVIPVPACDSIMAFVVCPLGASYQQDSVMVA